MNPTIKRLFDIILGILLLLLTFPFLVIISFLLFFSFKDEIFFRQIRIGRNTTPFKLYKFRTMYKSNLNHALLTTDNDSRITKVGLVLRKYKLDEIPQLINAIKGDMSFVGPRPEVPRYVALYDSEQKRILQVKPGLTSYASIAYRNESEILGRQEDPEKYYVEKIMPHKIKLDMKYVNHHNLCTDLKIIGKTIRKVFL